MKKQYPDFEQIPSDIFWNNAKRDQFDMVYYNAKTGEVMIVEAKGGGSTRGVRKDNKKKRYVEQGTKEYRESIEMSMNRQMEIFENTETYQGNFEYESKFEDLISTMSKIKAAGDKKIINSIQITQKLKSDGSLKGDAVLAFFEN